eukprot:CAMPEP_0206575362 /NCGR_PEP_ID=MMETSP0325_2-20121206/30024_1 /ASSEMBLY_ACC=CAM_ASM_000347 /TAXON_ID=2866 /ORGANISM="Crypthecodinium cohnii, Strain Seligo" /LENGTH=127 /DNA_ID=CAMNT_0054080199 /DNA_START=346 /DNA_END=726 /DNA_ORIENTATION=+
MRVRNTATRSVGPEFRNDQFVRLPLQALGEGVVVVASIPLDLSRLMFLAAQVMFEVAPFRAALQCELFESVSIFVVLLAHALNQSEEQLAMDTPTGLSKVFSPPVQAQPLSGGRGACHLCQHWVKSA